MYLNSDNWFKASIEYEDEKIQRLGSVVTNHGYSDWATTDISSNIIVSDINIFYLLFGYPLVK